MPPNVIDDQNRLARTPTVVHTADQTVTSASATILAANLRRKGLILQNTDPANNVRVRLDGGVATATNGLLLTQAMGPVQFSAGACPTNLITAFRAGAADCTGMSVTELT